MYQNMYMYGVFKIRLIDFRFYINRLIDFRFYVNRLIEFILDSYLQWSTIRGLQGLCYYCYYLYPSSVPYHQMESLHSAVDIKHHCGVFYGTYYTSKQFKY